MSSKLLHIKTFANKYLKKKKLQKQNPDNILNHFHRTRSVFIHIPKTAGHSVRVALYGANVVGVGHTPAHSMRWLVGPINWRNYFTFTFVRHPYEKIRSAYYYLKAGGKFPRDNEWAEKNLSEFDSFEQFVTDWVTPENIRKKVVFAPQSPFIYGKFRRNKLEVDYVGKLETINNDFEIIKNVVNKDAILKKKNVTEKKEKLSDAVNAKLEKKIYNIYKEDYIKLGYKKKYTA